MVIIGKIRNSIVQEGDAIYCKIKIYKVLKQKIEYFNENIISQSNFMNLIMKKS